MQSTFCHEIPSIIYVFVLFSLLFSPILCTKVFREENSTSITSKELNKMKLINDRLQKINKPFVKSINSPDGDIIDCVLFHLQPAFDLPELRGEMTLISPELPKGYANEENDTEIKQLWNLKGESCPNGTIPIRRATPSDLIYKSTRISMLGRNDNPDAIGHEHAIGYVSEGEFYGARAFLNIWEPNVNEYDFSLSQIWVVTDISTHPLNTIEVGWHVYPLLHKDHLPRIFTYWTPDGYRSGCYNLACSGFVQTNQKVVLGGALDPKSTYNGRQTVIHVMILKEPKSGNWWLRMGTEVIGYWPKKLFTDLQNHATMVQYGGEVFSENTGKHTTTQMGSGHFPDEGFTKAAYIRNLGVVDHDYHLQPASNLHTFATKHNCYSVEKGYKNGWANYIYFGGPGYNPNCP